MSQLEVRPMSRLRTGLLLGIAVAVSTASGQQQSESAGVPRTPYTGEMKKVAERILKSRANREQLDREYDSLKKDLAKTIILNSSSKEKGYNSAVQAMKRMDQAIKEYNAIKNKDLGAAAEVLGKETITLLIKALEPTQPEAALALKVLKAGTDTSIVVGKMVTNRQEAAGVSANVSEDLNALNQLIAREKEYRQSKSDERGRGPGQPDVKPPDVVDPPPVVAADRSDDDFDEINPWIDGGDRSAFGPEDSAETRARRDAFYARYPILEQFRGVASFRSPADEFDEAGGFALLAEPPSFDPSDLSPEEFDGWLRNQERSRPRSRSYTVGVTSQDRQGKQGVIFDGSYHSLDRGNTWHQNAGTPYETGGQNVIVDGGYHSLDGGRTWLLNKGTPFENGLNKERALLDEGPTIPDPQGKQAAIFQGSYHSLDGGNTWHQNAGTPYETGGQNVILDGGYHSLDGGQTWLLNKGTPFENGLPSQRARLDEGSSASNTDVRLFTSDEMYIQSDPATPSQIANARRELEKAAKEAEKAEQRKSFSESGSGSEPKESRWAKALPWIRFGLAVLDTYNQIEAQRRYQEYQRYQAQQRQLEQQRRQMEQQRAQAAARTAASRPGLTPGSSRAPGMTALTAPGGTTLSPVPSPQMPPLESLGGGACGPGMILNPQAVACAQSPVFINGVPNMCHRVGGTGPYIPWCIRAGK